MVQRTENFLTAEQKTALDAQLSTINPALSMTDALLVNQFTTAKMFVHSCITN